MESSEIFRHELKLFSRRRDVRAGNAHRFLISASFYYYFESGELTLTHFKRFISDASFFSGILGRRWSVRERQFPVRQLVRLHTAAELLRQRSRLPQRRRRGLR